MNTPPMHTPSPDQEPNAVGPGRSFGRSAGMLLAGLLLALVLVLVAAGLAAWHSSAVQLRLLRAVPGLSLDGVQGRLTGGPLVIDRLRWQGAGTSVEVDDLRWQDAVWRWRPHAGAWLGLDLAQARARAVRVDRTPAPATPSTPPAAPTSLPSPVALTAAGLQIDSISLDGTSLLTALAADLKIGADGGATHRIEHFSLLRGELQVKGDAAVGTDGALPVTAALSLATPSGQPTAWQAQMRLRGPLQRLAADVDLRAESGATLQAQAALMPFAAWPLAALTLKAQDVDLSTLMPGLPETALSGTAALADVTAGQALRLQVDLRNAKAGAWDAGRLPVRRVQGTLQGRTDAPDRLVFDGWTVDLGGPAAGGQVTLAGSWQGAQLALELQLQAVQTAQLATRAPPAAVDGQLKLELMGLALPGGAAPTTAQTLSGQVTASLRGTLPRPKASSRQRPPPPLELRTELSFTQPADGSLTVDVTQFEATAGPASTRATLDARRDTSGTWALKSEGQLGHMDLAAWWADAMASDLNGNWNADLRLPSAPAASLLERLRGDLQLQVRDSLMAGLAVTGKASLQAADKGLDVDAQLQAAGNRLQLKGSPGPDAGTPQWRAALQAPALAALAPLVRQLPAAQGWVPESGAVTGTATASGQWPALRSDGELQIDDLRTAQLQLRKGSLRWTFTGTALDAPLSLQADVSGLAQAERRIDRLQASLNGSLRQHTLNVRAESPLRPPAWTDPVATGPAAGAGAGAGASSGASTVARAPARAASGVPGRPDDTPKGSSLQIQAQGEWQPASAAGTSTLGAGEWRGTLSTLHAGPRAAGAEPWLSARDLKARLTLDAQGRPAQGLLAAGRLQAFGAGLVWQQAQWQAAERPGQGPRITLEAQLEPLALAPLLARLQPASGWQGDLLIGGRASVRSGETVDADIVIDSRGGDLGVTVAGRPRTLGITALRVALAAHNGRWELSQALTGRQLGTVAGSQVLQVPAGTLWPSAETPLEGAVSLQVADASVWSPWLPAGWRLGGGIHARAVLGGVLGAPTISGDLEGQKLLVRNILEGIHLRDGALRVRLDQRQAVIEQAHFLGGAGGTLDVSGRVTFEGQPQVQLKLTADSFRALDRVDRRVALSGSADLGLQDGRLAVKGNFKIDEGLIDVTASDAPSLDDDILVVGRRDAQGKLLPVADAAEAARQGVLAGADIDLRVAMGDALRVRGKGLDTRLTGQLRISSNEAGALVARGVINTAEGTYKAYGQNLAIKRGAIRFTGDLANPQLDILALRADIDNPVGVVVSGYAIDPRVRLYSEPDLPEMDQLTWLLTGQAPQGQGRDQSALLQRAALALLAGDRGASDEGFLQRLGIDQLGVARSDGGDTVVTIGKQLSKRLSIVYEKGLSAAAGSWALLYRIAGRTSVRARTGVDNAVEVIWSWRWD
jgi:translocation and assembly module TamB